MKFVFLVLAILVAAIVAQNTICKKANGAEPVAQEILEFLEGFALGIESDIGNVTECTKDANITLNDFHNAFIDIEYGIQHVSVSRLEKGIQEFGAGVQEISVALQDCNVTKLVSEIEQLAKDLKSGTAGIIKILYKEAIVLWSHGKEITADFKNAIKYWKAQQFQLAGVQVGKIVGFLLDYDANGNYRGDHRTRF